MALTPQTQPCLRWLAHAGGHQACAPASKAPEEPPLLFKPFSTSVPLACTHISLHRNKHGGHCKSRVCTAAGSSKVSNKAARWQPGAAWPQAACDLHLNMPQSAAHTSNFRSLLFQHDNTLVCQVTLWPLWHWVSAEQAQLALLAKRASALCFEKSVATPSCISHAHPLQLWKQMK